MNLENLRWIVHDQSASAEITVPDRTGLYDVAGDNITMVTAYLRDGDTFLASKDPVNALAAYSYALGWLHCGASVGFLSVLPARCPFVKPIDPLPATFYGKLTEKAQRYSRLLTTARSAIVPAAENGSPLFHITDHIFLSAECYLGQGNRFLGLHRYEDALASFSYGHGWLDAGIRAGLIRVLSDRDLFTI